MKRPGIKICGLTDFDTYQLCAECGVDWVGLVYFPPSPRHLDILQARALARHADNDIDPAIKPGRVVLTVDASDSLLDDICTHISPDMIQLHGSESPQRADDIRRRFGIKTMTVIKVKKAEDISLFSEFKDSCDWVLFDAAPTSNHALPGGRGHSFDWSPLESFTTSLPWMLAGGLNAANVAEAIQRTSPSAVDVSSGVERRKGIKDHTLIREFIHAVNNASHKV